MDASTQNSASSAFPAGALAAVGVGAVAAGGGEGGINPKLKLTCENCVRAKVKCSGQPGPCERCAGWRNLDCVFLEERKRGRPRLQNEEKKAFLNKLVKSANSSASLEDNESEAGGGADNMEDHKKVTTTTTRPPPRQGTPRTNGESKLVCVTSDCWSSVGENRPNIPGPVASPSAGLSPEQAHVVEIFFELYKNHASNRSCCRAWFSRQLNKICAMLKAANSLTALLSVVEWMNRHQILVSPAAPPEQRAFSDPDSGFLLPPMTSTKGPLLKDDGIVDTPAAPSSGGPLSSPVGNGMPHPHDPNLACIFLQYSRDERCAVRTNESFVRLFGRDAAFFASLLDSLYGGILPWGADVFSSILARPIDALLLIRVLAFRFQSLPRMMNATPLTRTVQTSHLFTCSKADGSLVDCIVRFTHVENISFQGVGVDVTATFEPYASSGTITAQEQCQAMTAAARAQQQQQQQIKIEEDRTMTTPRDGSQPVPYPYAEDFLIGSDEDIFSRGASGEFKDEWMEDLLKWVDDKDLIGGSPIQPSS